MRLDKYISSAAGLSRKEVKAAIKAGRITVNGSLASRPETAVSETDTVTLDSKAVVWREFIYLMLNKPQGYVSATEDNVYPPVTDLVPRELAHFKLFPVGRLDVDTEGLLLLTNDGALAHRLTSPKHRAEKTYLTRLDAPATHEDCDSFRLPMDLGDFVTLPAKAELTKDPFEVMTTVCEGKFHQVKRMWEKRGRKVVYLKRISMGGLLLDEKLGPGQIRELSPEEIAVLKTL